MFPRHLPSFGGRSSKIASLEPWRWVLTLFLLAIFGHQQGREMFVVIFLFQDVFTGSLAVFVWKICGICCWTNRKWHRNYIRGFFALNKQTMFRVWVVDQMKMHLLLEIFQCHEVLRYSSWRITPHESEIFENSMKSRHCLVRGVLPKISGSLPKHPEGEPMRNKRVGEYPAHSPLDAFNGIP